MKRLTLFLDADDTLFDFDAAETAAVSMLFKDYGFLKYDGIVPLYKENNLKCWKALERGEITRAQVAKLRFKWTFDNYNIEFGDYDNLNKEYWVYLGQQTITLKGAEDFLKKIYKENDLYIVTNGTTHVQNNRFKLSGLDKYFIRRFISEQIGSQKPSKEFFDYIEKELKGIDRENAYIIGDSLTSDMKAGVNANIKTIWFNLKRESIGESKVNFEVHNFDELYNLIEDLRK